MRFVSLNVLLVFLVVSPLFVLSACPYSNGSLKKWSEAASWTSNAVPTANANVVIGAGMNIVLDVSPPALGSLQVINGGKLIWGDYDNLEIVSAYILVKDGGEMWVGSEDCKFRKNATITLTGNKDSQNVVDFGNKFVGVGAGGTLELHGADFAPTWTKLTKTVTPITYNNINKHEGRGMTITTFSPVTAEFIETRRFDTFLNETFSENLAVYVNSLPKDTFVAVYSADEAANRLTSNAVQALQTIGSALIQNIRYRSAWACIGIKGAANGTAVEEMKSEAERPTSVVTRTVTSSNGNSVLISVQSQNWTGVVTVEDRTQLILTLADSVSSWKAGQKIVVASTDTNYEHAEENEIIACSGCANNQIKLKQPFKWVHWGEMVHGVDERAEVGLLTRTIVIRGRMSSDTDEWGAHTKVIANFTNAHFENVEYYNVGQPILAMYPVHFHMTGDVDRLGGYSNPAYVKGCSVHKSFSRCFTLHGVNGLLVKDNVAHDHIGHCYFVEDGAEMRNQLIGNLGLTTKWGKLILSEMNPNECAKMAGVDRDVCRGPSTFWITNPNNTLIGNSAAGSVFNGIWYIFPVRPTGPSKLVHQDMAIQNIPMAPCDDNMVHSSPVGFFVDDGIVTDESSPNYLGVTGARYKPRESPNSRVRVPAVIKGLTVHHSNNRAAWLRGGDYRMKDCFFADNSRGLTLASEGGMPNEPGSSQEIDGGIFVGRSANGQSYGTFPVRGYEIYDGPIRCIRCSFYEFVPTATANISAIGFFLSNMWQLAPVSYFSQAKFDDKSTRVFGGITNTQDGDRNQVVLDLDGSITGVPRSSIVNNYPVHTTKMCSYRADWNMSVCPHRYVIKNNEYANTNFGTRGNGGVSQQDETSHYRLEMQGIPGDPYRVQFQPMAIMNKTYTLHWAHSPPTSVDIQMTNFATEDWLRIGVCFPTTATIEVLYGIGTRRTPLQPVASIDQLAYNGGPNITSYYWDASTGMLFVVLKQQYARIGDEYCGANGCEHVRITARGTNTGATSTAPGYCAGAYPKYAVVEPEPPSPSPTISPSSTTDTTGADNLDSSASSVFLSVASLLALFIVLLA